VGGREEEGKRFIPTLVGGEGGEGLSSSRSREKGREEKGTPCFNPIAMREKKGRGTRCPVPCKEIKKKGDWKLDQRKTQQQQRRIRHLSHLANGRRRAALKLCCLKGERRKRWVLCLWLQSSRKKGERENPSDAADRKKGKRVGIIPSYRLAKKGDFCYRVREKKGAL